MNNISLFKKEIKPYRYTIKGKTTIIESNKGNYVIKESNNKDIIDIFKFLKSRDFTNYPNIINEYSRHNKIIYEYVEDNTILNPSKSEDLISLVGLLHSKTSFRKEVREETYKEIYEDILNNINYLKDYYDKYYELFLKSIYNSPSEYLFLRNYSKINAALNFSLNELNNWYDLVKEKHNERISLIHNNLSLDHYIKSDKDYLISWDNAKFDTPILDLYKLYLNNYFDLEFTSIYDKYKSYNNLSDEEEKLFFILISLPKEISFVGSEMDKCKNMRNDLDYLYKTEMFLKPYYDN